MGPEFWKLLDLLHPTRDPTHCFQLAELSLSKAVIMKCNQGTALEGSPVCAFLGLIRAGLFYFVPLRPNS